MVEVISMVRTINLGYGTITRDSPFRSELVKKKVKTFKMKKNDQ